MTDLVEIERMTIYEYDLRLRAWQKERIYRDYDIHLQAWCNAVAQSTKSSGKKVIPVYKTFKEFFNLEERLNNDKTQDKNPQIERYKEFMRKKKNGDV